MKITVKIPGSSVCVDMPEAACKNRFRSIATDLLGDITMTAECEPEKEVITRIIEPVCTEIEEAAGEELELEVYGPDEEYPLERFRARGILYIECPDCGKRAFVSAREPIDHFICRECDWVTMFDKPLKHVNVNCSYCGQSYYVKTNIKDEQFDVNCRNCKAPAAVQYNEKKDQYFSIGEDEE